MIATYILLVVLLTHIALFKKIIFKWNIFGVFFIATIIFAVIGVLAFPFFKPYFFRAFISFKLELISDSDIIQTQIILVCGLLLVLYAYMFSLNLLYGKVKCINHLNFKENISDNLSNINYYFISILIVLFVFTYLFINRDVVITGIAQGMLGREPEALLASRRGITSNYLYTIIVYNMLPFVTIVSLYKSIRKNTLYSRVSFLILFSISFFLILMLFQKRPLIIFMLSLLLAGHVFRGKLVAKKRKRKVLSKRQKKRKYIIYFGFLFSLLLILYYSATTYQFQNLFEAILKLSEIVLTRVFGRLSIPAFMYVHYFPEVGEHYGLTNIGMLSNVFGFEHFEDTKTLYTYFSKSDKDGSLAINSIVDFYGGFGYAGLFVGNVMLGFLLAVLDRILNKLEKNNINIVFTVFCFVFAYYLSQASLPRALMGYGFVFFIFMWLILQRGFKIKLRRFA